MKCLNCHAELTNYLVKAVLKDISYDACEVCGSFWLDATELDKMAEQVEGSIEYSSRKKAEGSSEREKFCPRCEDMVLDKVVFVGHSDIVLDRCSNCHGFWLDGGELDLINKELKSIMPIEGAGFSRFMNRVHLPFWYKRIRRPSSGTDFSVPIPPIDGAKEVSESPYSCSRCQKKLNVFSVLGVELEECPECKGIWLDSDELRNLKDQSEKKTWGNLRWVDDEVEAIETSDSMLSNLTCPKCDNKSLLSTGFGESSIILDWCPTCRGTWLDRREFQEIIEYLKTQLDDLSSAEMAEKAREEIGEIRTGPEGKLSEILDAKAALSALSAIKVYEHPKLAQQLIDFYILSRGIGLY